MVWNAIVVTYVALTYEYWVIYNIPKNICASPNTSKFMIFWKSGNLGRSLQFSASLSDLMSTAASSDNHDSINNFNFSTIIHSTIIFMSRNFIWDIKNAYRIICYRETDRLKKTSWMYSVNMAKIMENEYNYYLIIIRYAQLKYKDSFFFQGGIYMNYLQGL